MEAGRLMALAEIHGGARIDILNVAELEATLGTALGPEARQAWWQEAQDIAEEREIVKARGLKRIEMMLPLTSNPTTTFIANTVPEEGNVWSLKLVSVILGGSGTFAVYKAGTSGDTRRLLGQATSVSVNSVNQAVVTWGSDQARLRHGEGLYLAAGAAMLNVLLVAWQAPSEMEYKLL